MALGNRQTDLNASNNFSSSIDKISPTQYVSEPCNFGGEVVHADTTK